MSEAVADTTVGDLRNALHHGLFLQLIGAGREVVRRIFDEQRECLGVALSLDVHRGVVWKTRVELALIVLFEERGIGCISQPRLHLPIAREEMLMLPQKSAADI